MMTYIAPEVYDKAVALRADADALKTVLREGPMALAEKIAIKRRIAELEAERRSMLLAEYASGNIA